MEISTLKLFFLFIAILLELGVGLGGVFSKKNDSDYYMSVNMLLGGILGFLFLVNYYFTHSEILFITGFCITFLLQGIHGIIYRKKIKNVVFNRFNISEFLGGVILILPIVFYFFGWFHK